MHTVAVPPRSAPARPAETGPVPAPLAELAAAVRPQDTLLLLGDGPDGARLLLLGTGPSATGAAASVAALGSGTYALAPGRTATVRFCGHAELASAAARTAHCAEALVEPAVRANAPSLDEATRHLLHRVRTGRVLANESIAQHWRETLRTDRLADFLLAEHLGRHRELRRAAAARLADGEPRRAQWTLRESLTELLGALLAALGETDPDRTGWLPLLDLHAGSLGPRTARDLADALLHWHDGATAEGHVRAALAVADSVRETVLERAAHLPLLRTAHRP
ncbi:hypothetical protein ACFYVL_36230 [Streptomyces sp. NPDC004111]|uniref:hypothetical protein n=1 Tax=Streptomyces sp. NPDC004111 TaxID=3364690 RepID=UPI00367E9583